MNKIKFKDRIDEYLYESNAIEGVWDLPSLELARQAWDYLIKQKNLTEQNILKCHKILMYGKLEKPLLGHYRQQPVWVGTQPGRPWWEIPDLMTRWIDKVNLSSMCHHYFSQDDIISHHIRFETIHPFVDGNGRLGRMLMLWETIKNGYNFEIIYEKDKLSYLSWFL